MRTRTLKSRPSTRTRINCTYSEEPLEDMNQTKIRNSQLYRNSITFPPRIWKQRSQQVFPPEEEEGWENGKNSKCDFSKPGVGARGGDSDKKCRAFCNLFEINFFEQERFEVKVQNRIYRLPLVSSTNKPGKTLRHYYRYFELIREQAQLTHNKRTASIPTYPTTAFHFTKSSIFYKHVLQ